MTEPAPYPMLDIGGDVGAMVVYLDACPPSGELEACPAAAPAERFHTGVHRRPLGEGSVLAAVFPSVEAGRYHLLGSDGEPIATVDVVGGHVVEHHLVTPVHV